MKQVFILEKKMYKLKIKFTSDEELYIREGPISDMRDTKFTDLSKVYDAVDEIINLSSVKSVIIEKFHD